jgi:hypothetical protein
MGALSLVRRRPEAEAFRAAAELCPIAAVDRAGLAITADGVFLRAIEVIPPNTLLLSHSERQLVASGYGQLVSRLRPGQSLQFYVESRPVDLAAVLEASRAEVEAVAGPMAAGAGPAVMDPDAISRWRLYAAMEDSIRRHASDQTAVRMRAICLVPYVPRQRGRAELWRALRARGPLASAPLERELAEHRATVDESLAHTEMIRTELDALRLTTRLLNGEELVELWWSRFNPTAADAGRRPRASAAEVLRDLDGPCSAAAAEAAARRLRESVARSAVDFEASPKHVEVDRDAEQAIYAATTADATYIGALMGAMLTREPFALSVFVHALDRQAERARIKAGYRRIFAINRGAEAKGRVPDFDRYAREREAEEALAQMSGESRANFFRVAIYQSVRVPGPDPDLRRLSAAVDHCADEIELSTDAKVNKGEFRQRELWESTLPFGRDVADRGRRYSTRNAGDLVPLTGTVCGSPEGIPFAFSEPMRTLERLDPWDRTHSNFVGIVGGRGGAGKTVSANAIVSRCIAHGAHGFAIDRAGHYGTLVGLISGAQEIELGSGETPYAINPWDVPDPARVSLEKISFLLGLHAVMMGEEGLTVLERSQLAAAIRGVYATAALEGSEPRESMLRDQLHRRASEEQDSGGDAAIAATLRNLAERLGEFCGEGVYAYLADRSTTVEAEAPFVVFDTRHCPEEVIAPQMFAIIEFVQRRIEARASQPREAGRARWANRSILLLDEAWHLLRRKETGVYANDLARRSRHLGLFFLVSTQQLSDFDTPEGIALLRNSTMLFLLNQHADEVPFIREAFDLSDEEASLLTRLSTVKGSHAEMFWVNGVRGRGKVSVRLGPLEYWAFTSEPIRDAPLRRLKVEEHEGDVWAAVHELAQSADPAAGRDPDEPELAEA